MRRRFLIPLLAMAVITAGCAPALREMGPPTAAPALAGDHILAADGARLPLRVWRPDGPPRAVVLALHGFNDYSNSFADPAAFWATDGIVTYAYDQRGFGAAPNRGLWAGTETMVADLRDTARLVATRHPGIPLYLVGESMGGAVVLAALGDEGAPSADGAILVAPAVRGWRAIPWWQAVSLRLVAHTVPWATATGRGFKIRPSDNIEMLRALGRDPMVIKDTRFDAIYGLVQLMDDALAAAPGLETPTLLLYGATEDLVPRRGRDMLLEALPGDDGWRLAVYPNGYHMLLRDLQAETVLRDIAVWTADPKAPLPSAAERPGRRFGPSPESVE